MEIPKNKNIKTDIATKSSSYQDKVTKLVHLLAKQTALDHNDLSKDTLAMGDAV